jgi:hypothetical protein
MKRSKIVHFVVAAIVVLFLVPAARADSVDVTLTQTSQTAPAGSTVTFDATITNLSSTDTIYLNGDSFGTSSLLLTVDDSPYLMNFPVSLAPDEVSGPFALFNVLIDPSTPSATYDSNSFSILGGSDDTASDTIGTADFSVTVSSATAAPEPDTALLLVSGLLIIGLLAQFRRSSKAV